MKSIIESQFTYCPMISKLHPKAFYNKSNHIHERALKTAYLDYKDGSFTIDQRNTQNLTIRFLNTFESYLQQY